MEDQIYNMIVHKDEVTWQSIIQDLVRTEQLDPWNINISTLSQKYIEHIKTLQKHSFFVSGKMILASALLLRMKSYKLVDEYITEFDNQLFPRAEDIFEEDQDPVRDNIHYTIPPLLYKTPQPRKRQLTLNDLMRALEKALDVDDRRAKRMREILISDARIPEKTIDISSLIMDVYTRIKTWFTTKEKLTFSELVHTDNKEEKIFTFIPLLHLDTQQKVDLHQEEPFSEIYIRLPKHTSEEENLEEREP